MDTADLHPLLEDLTGNIDDLEESLAPLLNTALSVSTSKLPLLDKAKLYVLTTYAIESLLFSYLRLNGADAKNHPVFRELTRVKQYFEKIKLAESAPVKRTTTLDKSAAGRFVRHALSGNEEYDRKRAEQTEREKAGAKRKFEDMTEKVGSHTRFENMSKKMKADEAEELVGKTTSSDSENAEAMSGVEENGVAGQEPSSKKQRPTAADMLSEGPTKKEKNWRNKLEQTDMSDPQASSGVEAGQKVKTKKSVAPPKGHSEAFQALLKGPIPKEDEKEKKRSKKKRKSRGEKSQELEDKRAKEMM